MASKGLWKRGELFSDGVQTYKVVTAHRDGMMTVESQFLLDATGTERKGPFEGERYRCRNDSYARNPNMGTARLTLYTKRAA